MQVVKRIKLTNEMPYYRTYRTQQLVVVLPNGVHYNVDTLSSIEPQAVQYPTRPQIFGHLSTGQNDFVGYNSLGIKYRVVLWENGSLSIKDHDFVIGAPVTYNGYQGIRLSKSLAAYQKDGQWKLGDGENEIKQSSWKPIVYGEVFSGMLTNLGIFLDCVGCIGTFYRAGVIERIELAPPDHIELPDGSVGWKYEKHWLIRSFSALVEYQIGQIVGDEIYTGLDSQGKLCFTNYKTQQVRKV